MRPSRPTRGLPTSRAYWELKAEQMMNRVFAPEAPIDLDPLPEGTAVEDKKTATPHQPQPPVLPHGSGRVLRTADRATSTLEQKPKDPSPLAVLLLAALGGLGLVGALSAVLLVQQWAGLQKTLSQERNLLLVERLRTLGPATSAAPTPVGSVTPPAPVLDPAQPIHSSLGGAADLPPPPPEEPWMKQLEVLPVSRGPQVMTATTLPKSPTPQNRPGKAPKPLERFNGTLPQLVGLVGAPGQAGAAIFQIGETSTNVNVGEQIGTSGWRLSAADAESALIERGSEVRRIAIVAGG